VQKHAPAQLTSAKELYQQKLLNIFNVLSSVNKTKMPQRRKRYSNLAVNSQATIQLKYDA
jgi:hypothetical protein